MNNAQEDAVFVRNFSIILTGLAVIGIICFILAKIVYAGFAETQNADSSAAKRIAPVGSANVGEPMVLAGTDNSSAAATQTADISANPGQATYDKICFACHATGVGGAPKIGDKAAWEPRLQKGVEMLVINSINGFQGESGIMPARGGLPDISDEHMKAAVDYMLAAIGEGSGDSATESAPAPQTPASAPQASAEPPATDSAAAAVATAPDNSARGKEVYDSACFICHATGVAGAPKLGDVAAWSARTDKGMDVLYEHSIKGFMGEAGLMPPKGGRPDFSDDDVKAAVDYMINASK